MATSKILAACLMLASQTYGVPPAVLVGIYKAEGGQVGQEVRNTNGSSDLGPMQINTLWLPTLAEKWGVNESTARRWVRDDACTNVGVSAWILRSHIDDTKSLSGAIARYHSRTPVHGNRYKARVLEILHKNGLIKANQ